MIIPNYAVLLNSKTVAFEDVCKINYLSGANLGFLKKLAFDFRSRFHPYYKIEDSYDSIFSDESFNYNDLNDNYIVKKMTYEGLESFFENKSNSFDSEKNHMDSLTRHLNNGDFFENYAVIFDFETGAIESFCNIVYDSGEDSNLFMELGFLLRNKLFPKHKAEGSFNSLYSGAIYFPRNFRKEDYLIKRFNYSGLNNFLEQKTASLKNEENLLNLLGETLKRGGYAKVKGE